MGRLRAEAKSTKTKENNQQFVITISGKALPFCLICKKGYNDCKLLWSAISSQFRTMLNLEHLYIMEMLMHT